MMDKNKKTVRQLYDNIYGYIEFKRNDFDFILKDPFFLRLHNLKQMGLSYYVYPDALHTRFAHSLGVYENINKIINSQNSYVGTILKKEDIYKIRLSGLLHDIGHLPLSHTFEQALYRFDTFERELESTSESIKNNILSFEQLEDTSLKTKFYDEPKLHEKLGEFVLNASNISKVLHKKGISSDDIAAGFKGDIVYALEQETESKDNSIYTKQIRNFLHSQLDADRLDYLLRDSGFSGVKTGSFDIDKLLTSIVYDAEANYGVDESALRAIEQFFIGRFVAYCQIVGNKKVMAFEYMAQDFYYRLLKLRKEQKYHLGIRLYSYRDLTRDILINRPEEFLNFTDDYFFSLIREVLRNKDMMKQYDPIIVEYADMITNVQPLIPVAYLETFADVIDENNCLFEYLLKNEDEVCKICDEAGVLREKIIICEPFKVSIYKSDKDPIQIFRGRKKVFNNIIDSAASMFKYLADKEYRIYRIYAFSSQDAIEFKKVLSKRFFDFKYKGDV